ncbi:alkaline phosphatase [Bacillus sp. NPDC077027]|uniref:alkaline phosphatase n=1 Tax=Bacillus sp. NPDC077027 TaxID=3390548 RepID=UPI003CFFB3E5
MNMLKSSKTKVVAVATASVLAIGLFSGLEFGQPDKAEAKKKKKNEVQNVIVLIGDGMGTPYLSTYRAFKHNGDLSGATAFDPYLTGMHKTYPNDSKSNITDSAAAGTAMATGKKTYNNAISVEKNGRKLKTVLEEAKNSGKSTGLIVTSELTNATPAAYAAHDVSRKNTAAIADDFFDETIRKQHKVDIMLGGGLVDFVRKDRDLTKEFQQAGYNYVTNKQAMENNKKQKMLGIFADGGLDKAIDRNKNTPSLKEMTSSAIKQLSKNKKGFFLMVEGSQIDWAGHDHDIVSAMSEVADFEKAYEEAIRFAKKDQNTLVIATADHSTGGLSFGANGSGNWDFKPVKAVKKTPDYIAQKIVAGMSAEAALNKYIDLTFTKEELNSVEKAAETKDTVKIDDAIEQIINARSNTGWTTSGHTGDEVPFYAYGPTSDRFRGLLENTNQAKLIFKLLQNK